MSSSPPDTSPAGVVSAERSCKSGHAPRPSRGPALCLVLGRRGVQPPQHPGPSHRARVAGLCGRAPSRVGQPGVAGGGHAGLAQFLPMFALTLFAGHAADIYDRRKIMMAGLGVQLCTSALFAAMAYGGLTPLWPIYAVAALFGWARAFYTPAGAALAPTLVERRLIRARSSSIRPATRWRPSSVPPSAGSGGVFACCRFRCVGRALPRLTHLARWLSRRRRASPVRSPRAGRSSPKASITCGPPRSCSARSALTVRGSARRRDRPFAGLCARYPARRAESGSARRPSAGAIVTGFVLAARPLKSHAGLKMFAAVGIYGLSTLVFALSRSMVLSARPLRFSGRPTWSRCSSPDAGADRDARSHARAGLRGVQPVHRRVERIGRIRIRRHGALARTRRLGGVRRLRRDPRDPPVGGDFPALRKADRLE